MDIFLVNITINNTTKQLKLIDLKKKNVFNSEKNVGIGIYIGFIFLYTIFNSRRN